MIESESNPHPTDKPQAPGAATGGAKGEFRAAANKSLESFEARWTQELEQGLQEFDARHEQIVSELKVFFEPTGALPNLPLPDSMAAVYRAHVDEVVKQLQSREARLVEELHSALKAEWLRYKENADESHLAAPDAAPEATATAAANAAAGSVLFQFNTWTLVAASTPIHLDNISALVDSFVDDCFDLLCEKLPASMAFLVKLIRNVRKWSKRPLNFLGKFSPHHLLIAALKGLAAPARGILRLTLSWAVKQAMSKARERIKTQFNEHAAAIVQQSREFIEKAQQERAS